MALDVITIAWRFMRRRKFATAIKILLDREEIYEDDFEFYLTVGIACLYAGDIGTAETYFKRARRLNVTDTRLLLAQAAIYLRHGNTERALQYYIDIKGNDPNNKTADEAMEFIRTHGDYNTICKWVDTGKLERFYPPLGVNPQKVASIVIPALALILGCVLTIVFIPHKPNYINGERMDLTSLALTDTEKKNPQETDLSGQSYRYILSDKEITTAYNDSLKYFQSHRDNAAIIEVNRILNSNASLSIKQKARIVLNYVETPTFDSLTDSPDYKEVERDPALYLDCWVSWGGKITNAVINADGSYSCQLLVGYETGDTVDGIVLVRFAQAPNITPDQPLKILGKISSEDNKIYLKGRAVYQSVKNGLLQ